MTISAALEYLDRGWIPVRLWPSGGPDGRKPKSEQWSKRPVSTGGWQNTQHTRESILAEWTAQNNVGIVLGEPSGWLVDIDLDCPETHELAHKFLPETMTFGRASAPSSHWLYRCTGAKTRQYRDTDKSMLVEVRSTGGQTVFPGSTHELSGERIIWTHGCAHTPTEIDSSDLYNRVAKLAVAALLNRHGCIARGLPDDVIAVLANTTLLASPDIEALCNRWLDVPSTSVLERARRYVAAMPAATSGQGGHPVTWHVAVALRRGFGLSEDDAMGVIREYNARCTPPWTERELLHKIQDAANARIESGYLLKSQPPTLDSWTRKVAEPKKNDRKILMDIASTWTLGIDEDGNPSARIGDKIVRLSACKKILNKAFFDRERSAASMGDVKSVLDSLRDIAEGEPPLSDSGRHRSEMGLIWSQCPDSRPDKPEFLYDGLIPIGSVVLFAGLPGSAKTWAAIDLLFRASMGLEWLGRPCHGHAWSFLLTAETGESEAWDRLYSVAEGCGYQPTGVNVSSTGIAGNALASRHMASPEWEDVLMEIHKSSSDRKLIVIDSLTSMSPGIDENSNAIADGVNVCRRVARRTGMTIVIISHARKQDDGKAISSVGGNRAIIGATDVAYLFTSDDDGTTRTIRQIRNQMAPANQRLGLHELNLSGNGDTVSLSLGNPVVIAEKRKSNK